MLSGSLLIAKIGGTEIRLHWSMILIIPYVLATFRPGSTAGLLRAFLLVGLIFLFVLLHELGHTLMARIFGIRVPSVVLWPLGGAAMTEREAGKPIADLLIAAAGPLVNLLLGGAFFVLFLWSAGAEWLASLLNSSSIISQRMLVFLAVSNVILALSNLLPMYPLDGGRIFRAVVNMVFGPARSNLVTFWFSLALGIALLVAAVAMGSLLLAVTAVLLLAGAITLNQPLLARLMGWYARLTRSPQAYLRLADFDPALELISRRIEVDPHNPVLYLQRGYIHYTLDELVRALADADRALRIVPDIIQAWLLKSAVFYALGNRAEVWACHDQVDRIRPDWSVSWMNGAILLRDEDSLEKAMEYIQRAFEAAAREHDRTGLVLMHLVRSSIAYRQGQPENAHQDWEEAYRISSRDAMTFSVDRQRIFAPDWTWVTDYFAFLESKNPHSPNILAARGETALRAGKWQQAVDDFSRLIQQMPALQDISLYRGQAYEELGQVGLAVQDYRRAKDISRRAHIRRMAEDRLKALATY